jgi:UDP-glucose 4-epimerase
MVQRTHKVVVTGGAGFIGSHLVDRLLAATSAEIVVFDNFHRGRLENLAHLQNEARVRVIHGDIRDTAAVHDVVRDAGIVYHLGAQSTVMGGARDIDYTFSSNVIGTHNVLRAAADHGVDRLVFASSREVYGEPIDLPVDEDAPLLAINCYGASKIAGEAFCRAFRREFGLQSVILRFANVYGPRDIGRVIPSWVERAAAGRDLDVYGGKQVIDFVWVDNAVNALMKAGLAEGPLPPINVGSGTGTRIVDLARRIARLASARSRVNLLPARPVEVTRFVANVDRMREMLGVDTPLDPLSFLPRLMSIPMLAGIVR